MMHDMMHDMMHACCKVMKPHVDMYMYIHVLLLRNVIKSEKALYAVAEQAEYRTRVLI